MSVPNEMSFADFMGTLQPDYCNKLYYVYLKGGVYPLTEYPLEQKYKILDFCIAVLCPDNLPHMALYPVIDSSKAPQEFDLTTVFDEPQKFSLQNELGNQEIEIAAGKKYVDFLEHSTLSIINPAKYESIMKDNPFELNSIDKIIEHHAEDIGDSMISDNGSGNSYDAIQENIRLEASLLSQSLKHFDKIMEFQEMADLNYDGATIKGDNAVNSEITSMFNDVNGDPERIQIIKKYGIIRSFIDMCHDYTWVIVPIINHLIELIDETHGKEFPGIGEELIQIKEQIITMGGKGDNVNQISCRNVWKLYIEKYRIELQLPYIFSSNFGNYGSCNIWNDPDNRDAGGLTPDFNALIIKLKSDGFDFFCVESQNCPAGKEFIKNRFSVFSAKDWKRDAGSGYSNYKKDEDPSFEYKHCDLDVIYDPDYENSISEISIATQIVRYGPNCLPSQFLGLIDITSNSNNESNEMGVFYNGHPEIGVNTPHNFSDRRKFPQNSQFSLNGLIQTANELCGAGLSQPRGEGKARRIEDISLINAEESKRKLHTMLIMFLKTYTDYIQTYCMEAVKGSGIKCLAITFDNLCAYTFDGLFACPVALLLPNKITVSMPDLRYLTLSWEDKNLKFIVFRLLNHDGIKHIINMCISQQVKRFNNYLQNESFNTYNAAIYYACTACVNGLLESQIELDAKSILAGIILIEKFNNYDQQFQEQYLRQFPNTLSEFVAKLCKIDKVTYMFEEFHDKFMRIISLIFNVSSRMDPQTFVEHYYSVKQNIINVLKHNDDDATISIHIASIYAFVIGSRSKHFIESFIFALTSASQKEQIKNKDQDIGTYDLMQIMIEIVFTFKSQNLALDSYTLPNLIMPSLIDLPNEDLNNYEDEEEEKLREQIVAETAAIHAEEEELREHITQQDHLNAMAKVNNLTVESPLTYLTIINCTQYIFNQLSSAGEIDIETLKDIGIAYIISQLQEQPVVQEPEETARDDVDDDDVDNASQPYYDSPHNSNNVTDVNHVEQLRSLFNPDGWMGGRKNTKSNKLTKTKKPNKLTKTKKPKMTRKKKPRMTKMKKPQMTKTKKPKMTRTKSKK